MAPSPHHKECAKAADSVIAALREAGLVIVPKD
jgi:hypothetical protein